MSYTRCRQLEVTNATLFTFVLCFSAFFDSFARPICFCTTLSLQRPVCSNGRSQKSVTMAYFLRVTVIE